MTSIRTRFEMVFATARDTIINNDLTTPNLPVAKFAFQSTFQKEAVLKWDVYVQNFGLFGA